MPFAKNIGSNIGKKIRQNLSGKYNSKFLDHAKRSAGDVFQTASKVEIQKIGDLIGNKIANKIRKFLTNS